MDIKRKVRSPGSQGNAASEVSDVIARAGDWQYGRGATANDIEDEGQEEDLAFGVPHSTMDFDPKGGILAAATQMAGQAAQKVVDAAKQVKSQYKSGVDESKGLGNELKQTQKMYDYGRQALQQDQPQQQDKK